jgi:hypothetical protein
MTDSLLKDRSMLIVTRIIASMTILVGIISIAATLWLELRRDRWRTRLARNVESVLQDADWQRARNEDLKRAA